MTDNSYLIEHSNVLLLGFSETWLTPRIHDNLIKIDGFNIIRQDRKLPKRGGGLLLYVNSAADVKSLPWDMSCSDSNLEVLSANVVLPKQKIFLISLVYLPPSAEKAAALSEL